MILRKPGAPKRANFSKSNQIRDIEAPGRPHFHISANAGSLTSTPSQSSTVMASKRDIAILNCYFYSDIMKGVK